MKKTIAIAALILTILVGFAWAGFVPSISTGELDADTTVYTVPSKGVQCYLAGVQLYGDGTNAATLWIMDDYAANGGKQVIEIALPAQSDTFIAWTWPYPIMMEKGIYADIDGTGASFVVEYILR
jgi:hypothetical protein